MAYYAFLNKNNIVVDVIKGLDEGGNEDWEKIYADRKGMVCKRTSYNTIAGSHTNGGTPFRKNFAAVGFSYDESRDAFIPPKPYETWILNEDKCQWEPPIEHPNDGNYRMWSDEEYLKDNTKGWMLITPESSYINN